MPASLHHLFSSIHGLSISLKLVILLDEYFTTMDTYLLKAAVLYALSATSRTSSALDDFLQIASFASPDLDPLAYELFDLRAPLERLGDSELAIPRQLQQPVLTIVRASGDALFRIDTLLEDCTAESSCEIRWNAVRPKVQELKAGLCTCRRTLQLALEVLNLCALPTLPTLPNLLRWLGI